MNATESYLAFFQFHNGVLTLKQIMDSGLYGCEYRRYHTELRQQGHRVVVVRNTKEPSKNTYYLDDAIPKQEEAVKFDGEQRIFI